MLCFIEKFFYQDLAGIRGPAFHATRYMPPGYRQIDIQPRILGDLKSASASIKTVRGMVSSSWNRTGDSISLDVTIPVNSEAKVSVPKLGLQDVVVEEGGKVVWRNGSYLAGTGRRNRRQRKHRLRHLRHGLGHVLLRPPWIAIVVVNYACQHNVDWLDTERHLRLPLLSVARHSLEKHAHVHLQST